MIGLTPAFAIFQEIGRFQSSLIVKGSHQLKGKKATYKRMRKERENKRSPKSPKAVWGVVVLVAGREEGGLSLLFLLESVENPPILICQRRFMWTSKALRHEWSTAKLALSTYFPTHVLPITYIEKAWPPTLLPSNPHPLFSIHATGVKLHTNPNCIKRHRWNLLPKKFTDNWIGITKPIIIKISHKY